MRFEFVYVYTIDKSSHQWHFVGVLHLLVYCKRIAAFFLSVFQVLEFLFGFKQRTILSKSFRLETFCVLMSAIESIAD